MQKHYKFSIWYVLLGIWVVLLVQNYIASMFAAQVIPYSQFLSLLKAGKVTEIAVTANQIQGKMKVDGEAGDFRLFKTIRVDPDLSAMLEQYPVSFKGEIVNLDRATDLHIADGMVRINSDVILPVYRQVILQAAVDWKRQRLRPTAEGTFFD